MCVSGWRFCPKTILARKSDLKIAPHYLQRSHSALRGVGICFYFQSSVYFSSRSMELDHASCSDYFHAYQIMNAIATTSIVAKKYKKALAIHHLLQIDAKIISFCSLSLNYYLVYANFPRPIVASEKQVFRFLSDAPSCPIFSKLIDGTESSIFSKNSASCGGGRRPDNLNA